VGRKTRRPSGENREGCPVGYGRFRCDGDDRIVALDAKSRAIIGGRGRGPGRSLSFVETFRVRPAERKRIRRIMRRDSGHFLGEVDYEREDGENGILLLWEQRVAGERGGREGSAGYFTDVTAQRKWERELARVSREIVGSLDQEAIIDRVAVMLSCVIGCRLCSLVVFDEDGIKAHVRSPEQPGRNALSALTRLISKGAGAYLEYAIESTDMILLPKQIPAMSAPGNRSRCPLEPCVSVPLLTGTDLVGILHVGKFPGGAVDENARRFLFSIAPQIAFALHNARSYEKQKKLVQMKSDFLSNLSHSLRTPMATMKQTVSLLLRERGGPLTDVQQKFLGILDQNIDRLTGVLNNLLDLSKIEYGSMHLNRTEIDLVLLVKSVLSTFEATLIGKDLKLAFRARPSSIKVFVDFEVIRQVIEGLLGNAIKFTESGKRIKVLLTGGEKRVKITIEDQGCGMTKENIAMVFDKYRSFQVGIREGVRGTGLGLALTKEFVELHGGKIWIESNVGKGTCVSIVIPRMPFGSILQEKTRRAIELAGIRGEKLLLFLFIADPEQVISSSAPAGHMREKLGAYLGPLVRSMDGQIIADVEESRVALLIPVKDTNHEGVTRAVRRNMNELLAECGGLRKSLFSWVTYPEEGRTFAELLKSLLARAGIAGGDVFVRSRGGENGGGERKLCEEASNRRG
jgi:signal transduction histidine kinase